jgi:twitching motility protein PilT
MRTREYVEKGESEGKSLLDAMRDGSTEGMQYFDGELDKFIRTDLVEFETALGFATNAGNLRLELQDYLDDPKVRKQQAARNSQATEIEIER